MNAGRCLLLRLTSSSLVFFHSFEFLGSLLAHDAALLRVVSVTVDAVAALKKGENAGKEPEEVRAAGTFV